jgi:hypothetical protein
MAGLNGRQAFATDAAAVGQRGLAALARIAVEKPVLPFAADFRRLILAFHKSIWLPPGGKTGACKDSHETGRVKAGFGHWQRRKTSLSTMPGFSALGFALVPGYARLHRSAMTKALTLDLKKLKARAFDRAEWAGETLQRYHAAIGKLDDSVVRQLRGLYQWMFVPPTLWPFNIQDVLEDCLAALEQAHGLPGGGDFSGVEWSEIYGGGGIGGGKDFGLGRRRAERSRLCGLAENEFTVSIADQSRQHRQPDGFTLFPQPVQIEQMPSRASPVNPAPTQLVPAKLVLSAAIFSAVRRGIFVASKPK